jgi:Filamin/ABP280 repeat
MVQDWRGQKWDTQLNLLLDSRMHLVIISKLVVKMWMCKSRYLSTLFPLSSAPSSPPFTSLPSPPLPFTSTSLHLHLPSPPFPLSPLHLPSLPSPPSLFTNASQPPLSSPPVKADIIDKGDGTYDVKYIAKGNGKHTILVNVRGKPIQNSPFTVNAERLGITLLSPLSSPLRRYST